MDQLLFVIQSMVRHRNLLWSKLCVAPFLLYFRSIFAQFLLCSPSPEFSMKKDRVAENWNFWEKGAIKEKAAMFSLIDNGLKKTPPPQLSDDTHRLALRICFLFRVEVSFEWDSVQGYIRSQHFNNNLCVSVIWWKTSESVALGTIFPSE